jgi:5-methylcytosine-specific restriction protein A
MPWDSSNRRAELPPNWSSEIVPRIRRRDSDRCQTCGSTNRPEVDHIGDPHDHRDHNLRVLCHWHHAKRTAQQAAAARGPAVTERRPAERHPGLA